MAYPGSAEDTAFGSKPTLRSKVLNRKMLRDSFLLAEEETLPLFYVSWPHLGMVLNMRFSTQKISGCRKTGNGCILSAILQMVPQRCAVAESDFCEAKALNGSTGKIFPLRQSGGKALEQVIGGPQGSRIYGTGGIAPTITSNTGGLGAKTGLYFVAKDKERGLKIKEECGTIDASYYKGLGAKQQRMGILYSEAPRAALSPGFQKKNQNGRRIKEGEQEMFTLTAKDIHGILEQSRIRRLTPLEAFRLQGVPDEYFYRAAGVCTDTQLYKQAGNAVTVPVVRAIGEKIMKYLNTEKTKT